MFDFCHNLCCYDEDFVEFYKHIHFAFHRLFVKNAVRLHITPREVCAKIIQGLRLVIVNVRHV